MMIKNHSRISQVLILTYFSINIAVAQYPSELYREIQAKRDFYRNKGIKSYSEVGDDNRIFRIVNFDTLGNVISIIYPEDSAKGFNTSSKAKYFYSDNILQKETHDDLIITFDRDSLDKPNRLINNHTEFHYVYDKKTRLKALIDMCDPDNPSIMSVYKYSLNGRLKRVKQGRHTLYRYYYHRSLLSKEVRYEGTIATYKYHYSNGLISLKIESYEPDQLNIYTYEYGRENSIVKIVESRPNGEVSSITSYEYDSLGFLLNSTISYSYGGENKLSYNYEFY